MSALKLFTDEDIYAAVARELRTARLDAVSTPEAGRRGESFDSQLIWAASEGRVLVTFNVAHFAELHSHWIANGHHHAGVIVSSQKTIGDLIRRLVHLAGMCDAESMFDRLKYLSDW